MELLNVHWISLARQRLIIIIIIYLVSLPFANAGELARILRQAAGCTDAATCAGLTQASCSFPQVAADCPILCEDPKCLTSAQTGCVDAPSCTGLTVASCSFPAILADCPVLCDNCPKSVTGCQSGFNLVETQCLRFSQKAKTWIDAKTKCENLNATLVMPMDFDALVTYVLKNNLFYNQYWVGASNQAAGTYQWLNGSDVDDSLWYAGYQNPPFSNFGNDSCVKLHLQAYTSGLIAAWDTACSGTNQRHFICQEE